jgi:hypothetical protein
MKLFHYIFALGSAALLFSACESNLDKVVYNSNTAKPAVLQTLKQSSYVLNQDNTQDSAFTVTWTSRRRLSGRSDKCSTDGS